MTIRISCRTYGYNGCSAVHLSSLHLCHCGFCETFLPCIIYVFPSCLLLSHVHSPACCLYVVCTIELCVAQGGIGKGPLGSGAGSGLGAGFGQPNGAAAAGGSLFGNGNSGLRGGGIGGLGAGNSQKPASGIGALSGISSNLLDPTAKSQMPASMLAQPMFKPSNAPLFPSNDPKTQVNILGN